MIKLVALATLTLLPSLAFADSPGWITNCPYTRSLSDDPIKFPDQPGASHLHDFFGSTTANANSTYDSMVSGGTSCGTSADRAGYWAPALFRNGVKVNPAGSFGGRNVREKFYYRDQHLTTGTRIEPFPPDFRMIQGYGAATSVSDANAHGAGWGSRMWWGCSDNSVSGKPTSPPNCKVGIITLHVTFPNCWDGIKTTADAVATGHVKFPSSGKCPSSHPRALPLLIERLEYPVGTSGAGITLSSGAPYTAHTDFWNTWEQSKLNTLTTTCLNGDRNCGTNP